MKKPFFYTFDIHKILPDFKVGFSSWKLYQIKVLIVIAISVSGRF